MWRSIRSKQQDDLREWRANNETGKIKKNCKGGGGNNRQDGHGNGGDDNNEAKKLR